MGQIDVVERLKTFMKFDCSTPASFAKMTGVEASNFAKMLDGKQNITKRTLEKLAAAHSQFVKTIVHPLRIAKNHLRRQPQFIIFVTLRKRSIGA